MWSTVKDNYLYPDFNGVNWEDIYQEFLPRVQAGLTIQDFYAAMSEMIGRLNDEHSAFLNPQQVAEQEARYSGDFHYVGIGVVTMSVPERRRLTIGAVFPGSPAEKAGLRTHDNILQIDGVPIIDEKEDRRSLLRGPEGSQVTLTVQYPGEQPRQVTITRRAVQGSMPTPHQVLITPGGKRVGYILLLTFEDENIPNGVRQALKDLSRDGPLDGLIVDVRLNPGGASTIFENTISFFVQGAVGSIVNRQEKIPVRVKGEDIQGSQGVPLVVLTGQRTSSFGEIFAGVLQDLGRATIVGETTDGNVELLEVYPLQDGSRLWLAHDTYRPLNHPDLVWEKSGIIPDIKVSSNWDEVTLETDPIVQAALAHFDQ
jgi:C-terminal peptidase prc